jgi:hypothetical protein
MEATDPRVERWASQSASIETEAIVKEALKMVSTK